MFAVGDAVMTGALLQGDVLSDIQYLGALNYGAIHLSMPVTGGGGEAVSWTVAAPPHHGPAMVLSHSCEIAQENAVKVTSIILAPIRDVSGATPAGKLQELIASNLIDQSKPSASFLKYFYLPPDPKLQYSVGSVVDFSKCFSVRKNSYEYLLARKVLQLSDAARVSMSLKLALYFHRVDESTAA